jgi:hypothetical protein
LDLFVDEVGVSGAVSHWVIAKGDVADVGAVGKGLTGVAHHKAGIFGGAGEVVALRDCDSAKPVLVSGRANGAVDSHGEDGLI